MHQKLRQFRKQRGLTMKDLATRVGTSQQQIDRLEKGKRRLTLEWIDRLSEALDCSVVDLLPASHQHRDSKTAKAKVLGKINSGGKIEWYEFDDIYTLTVGRPKHVSNTRNFALLVDTNDSRDYPTGSELIFSEISSQNDTQISNAKFVVCERMVDGKLVHSVDYVPVRNNQKTIKAVLIKSIRNE